MNAYRRKCSPTIRVYLRPFAVKTTFPAGVFGKGSGRKHSEMVAWSSTSHFWSMGIKSEVIVLFVGGL